MCMARCRGGGATSKSAPVLCSSTPSRAQQHSATRYEYMVLDGSAVVCGAGSEIERCVQNVKAVPSGRIPPACRCQLSPGPPDDDVSCHQGVESLPDASPLIKRWPTGSTLDFRFCVMIRRGYGILCALLLKLIRRSQSLRASRFTVIQLQDASTGSCKACS